MSSVRRPPFQHLADDNITSSSLENVNIISFNPKWTTAELRKHQESDLDIGPVYRAFTKNPKQRPRWEDYSIQSPACKAYFAEWRRLQLHNGILYRCWENDSGTITRLQILVPRALRQAICEEVHDGRTTAHLGKRRAMRLLMKSVHWFKMDHDVNWWIRTCAVCQKRKIPKRPAQAPSKAFPSGHINERVSMDIVGPLKRSQSGNTVVLCMTDHFSKYSRAFALPDQKAHTVAKVFVDNWMHVFGQPLMVHADKGTNFESKLLQQICQLYGVDKTRTTSYRPQANAQTERYNQTLINIVAMLVDKDKSENWDEKLPIAVSAYNATEHASTGYTPNRLFFLREIAHNLDRMLPQVDEAEYESWDDYVRTLDKSAQFAYETARQAIGKAVKYQKRYYDRKQNLHKYKTGDAVLLRDHAQHERGEGKLADKFIGPFFVIDVLSDIHFRIARSANDKPKIVHHDAIKKFHMREPADLQWVYDRSKYHRRTAEPVTVEDINTNLTDMMRRLRSVEVQIGDFTRTAGRKRRPKRIPPQQQITHTDQPETAPTSSAQPTQEEIQVSTNNQRQTGGNNGLESNSNRARTGKRKPPGKPQSNRSQTGQPSVESSSSNSAQTDSRDATVEQPSNCAQTSTSSSVSKPTSNSAKTGKPKARKKKKKRSQTGQTTSVEPSSNPSAQPAQTNSESQVVPTTNSSAKPTQRQQEQPEVSTNQQNKPATTTPPAQTCESTTATGNKPVRRSTRPPKPKKR